MLCISTYSVIYLLATNLVFFLEFFGFNCVDNFVSNMASSRSKMLISLAKKTSVNVNDSTVTSATEENVNDICFDNLNNIDINEIGTFVFLDDTVLNDSLSYTINNGYGYTTYSISFDEYVPPRAVECISENSTSDNVHQSQAGDSDNKNIIIG